MSLKADNILVANAHEAKDMIQRLQPGAWLSNEVVDVLCTRNILFASNPDAAYIRFDALMSFVQNKRASRLTDRFRTRLHKATVVRAVSALSSNELNEVYIVQNHNGNHWRLWTCSFSTDRSLKLTLYDSLNLQPDVGFEKDFSDLVKFIFALPANTRHTVRRDKNGPTQNNGYDCGVYVIATMRALLAGKGLPERWNGKELRRNYEQIIKGYMKIVSKFRSGSKSRSDSRRKVSSISQVLPQQSSSTIASSPNVVISKRGKLPWPLKKLPCTQCTATAKRTRKRCRCKASCRKWRSKTCWRHLVRSKSR